MSPHLPIAYGLKDNSLPMSVMCNIINDIRNDLKEQNTGVLCEVYDQIIVKSEEGEPLTRLQHAQQIFGNMMTTYNRKELLIKLLIYSDILQDDLDKISCMNFRNGHMKELDGVRIYIRKVLKKNCAEKNLHRKY